MRKMTEDGSNGVIQLEMKAQEVKSPKFASHLLCK